MPAILRERASLQPTDVALTFVDYEQDWDGVRQTLTWSQLYRRVVNTAAHLRRLASPGDRAVVLAPQGLEYIVSVLGAIEAGIVAVPLSVPYGGVHDERTLSVLADTSPAVIMTTSTVMNYVAGFGEPQPGRTAPAIVELDRLDLDTRQRTSTRPGARRGGQNESDLLYLQYTSGSTRAPAGVMISNENLFANYEQLMDGYLRKFGNVAPPGTTVVSWLPFYHDMGFIFGMVFPVLSGVPAVLTSPVGFLQHPARWLQLMAAHTRSLSAAPNFAFDIAARKVKDGDLAGCDLGGVLHILNGSERVQPATMKRFSERFAPFNFDPAVLRPSYGMAEATVYIATREPGEPPKVVDFDSDKLRDGRAETGTGESGTPLISYGVPQQQTVRIVDADTRIECPDGAVGEIWIHGRNIGLGYWQKPGESARIFEARIENPSEGTPEGPWLRTGDSGFLFGRIKDLLIVYGRNHSPDDIEATIQEVTAGRCVAIAVPDKGDEKLVAIVELKKRDSSDEDATDRFRVVRRDVTSAISKSHGLKVADLVLVSPGSIPITTSGKVRRAQCVELYRQDEFTRLDA
jgi:long-chain fatty acid adenylyltransferase FadD28